MDTLDTPAREGTPAACADDGFALTSPHSPAQMRVTKRNGATESVDVNKIVRAVTRNADGLHAVDPLRVALKTIEIGRAHV